MNVDGRKIADAILERTKARAEKLLLPPKVVVIKGSDSPVTNSYVKIKAKAAEAAGCRFEIRAYEEMYDDADAVIVQLPLQEGIDAEAVIRAIPMRQDADVLGHEARKKFEAGDADVLFPPVLAAVKEILRFYSVDPKWKQIVIIGNGRLVGHPANIWFKQQGALVHSVTLENPDLGVLKGADIIISGAGSPHLIKPDMIKKDCVLIDAGTSELGGKVVGDADPACAEVASLFTPTPGGVGPIAVACLFENAVRLAERR